MARPKSTTIQGGKALELTMRDVLGGLEESVNYFSFRPLLDDLDILSINACSDDPYTLPRETASVHTLNPVRSTDIVNYLFQREQHG